MLLYVIATFCIVSAKAYSVLDESYFVVENDADELRWADSYTVKATKVHLTSNIIEELSAWKTNQSSRIDYNGGVVKEILNIGEESAIKYRIHPETTDEVLNEIVCHLVYDTSFTEYVQLTEILPPTDEDYEVVGNESIDDVYATRFELNKKDFKKEIRRTLWAAYDDYLGWIPVKYEAKKYNVELGSLIEHTLWTFFDYDPEFAGDDDIFDTEQYGCDENAAIKLTADSEKITKELMFINPDNEKHLDHVFNHFKNKYNRKYAHEKEHELRKAIFEKNVRMIESANKRNLTYKLGVNQFSDWTPEEIEMSHGAIPRPEGKRGTIDFPYEESSLKEIVETLPKEYDMRILGFISPVKDQGMCGSCWTFAASAVVESGLARRNGGKVISLSNQAIVDCAYDDLGEEGAGGCQGGFDFAAYDFIAKYGLPTDQEYGPYKAQDGYCYVRNMTKTYFIQGFTDVTHYSPNALKVALVNHGPLYIYVHVSEEFHSYSSGIFYQSNVDCNPERPNHAVTLVGYGERDGDLFWILKNSWGTSWGIDGYMLIAAKNNVCGVTAHPTYPVF